MRRKATPWVVYLQATAPAKPPEGQPCNGCGLCCAAAPCPVGMLITRRRLGPCSALEWHPEAGLYRCGLLSSPRRWVPCLPARLTRRLARRWIAASVGCDATLQPV